jgi:cell division protease FtsH
MNSSFKNFLIWLAAFIGLLFVFQMSPFSAKSHVDRSIAYSDFLKNIKLDQFSEIIVSGLDVRGKTKDGQMISTYAPERTQLINSAIDRGVVVRAEPPVQETPSFWHILLSWLPFIVIIGLSIFSMRQLQSGNNKTMRFGRSRAKKNDPEADKKITFNDVAGIDEAKQELQEIVEFLKDPEKFERLGGKIPKGVLLIGPPGTGKTLLAKAIAGEANVPYFSISGSDFVEMFVGVGASRVRDMFDQAKKNAPCIIFIDEIDAVGRHRGIGLGGGNDEREQTLNQMLVEMDGFEDNQGVIIVAATNRPDILDPALLRPGRFDRQVSVPNPDVNGRQQILKVHTRKIPVSDDVKLDIIARGTPGFSGADIANLCNEAALMAARKNKHIVSMDDFEQAKDRVMMGAERRSLVMTDHEKKITAYHEAGHAIISLYVAQSDPLHKITIIPRGQALGVTMRLPENDRISVTKIKLLADIQVAMGGRIAEEMIFGEDFVTTGASSDINMATKLAKMMIKQFGMSEKLGFQSYDTQQDYMGNYAPLSPATSGSIDEEIKKLLDSCYVNATRLLKDKKNELIILAEKLLEDETLSAQEVKKLLGISGDFDETPPEPAIKKNTKRIRKSLNDPKIPDPSPVI